TAAVTIPPRPIRFAFLTSPAAEIIGPDYRAPSAQDECTAQPSRLRLRQIDGFVAWILEHSFRNRGSNQRTRKDGTRRSQRNLPASGGKNIWTGHALTTSSL